MKEFNKTWIAYFNLFMASTFNFVEWKEYKIASLYSTCYRSNKIVD